MFAVGRKAKLSSHQLENFREWSLRLFTVTDRFRSVAQSQRQRSDCQCEQFLSPPSQTGPSGSDNDYKTYSRVSMRHDRICSAQPVIVMAAVAG